MTRESVRRIVEKTGLREDEALARILEHSPQKRLLTPEEVAAVVCALCSDGARGINGQAIVVDGGELLA
jgi:NAD(P)-dependent dehydrogenase (short-subunit alcohol dehydrogenase family)